MPCVSAAFYTLIFRFSAYTLSILARRAGCVHAVLAVVLVCHLGYIFTMYYAFRPNMLCIMDSAQNRASARSVAGLSHIVEPSSVASLQ
ncbi:hypothetical protein K438DRAFT_1827239 [Mycena galopus ATCC 62051]|nr:hypothetical protein K438DRAFT_1827239 [Mycena galopus ATCC 62051]